MKVYFLFSLESPQRGDSNEYTQYTISQYKKKIIKLSQIIPNLQLWDLFQGTQEWVWNIRGKRAISVRAIEVLLYLYCPALIADLDPGFTVVCGWITSQCTTTETSISRLMSTTVPGTFSLCSWTKISGRIPAVQIPIPTSHILSMWEEKRSTIFSTLSFRVSCYLYWRC